MTDLKMLVRELEDEIRSLKEAEVISAGKLTELYSENCHLNEMLVELKELNIQLSERTRELESKKSISKAECQSKLTLQHGLESVEQLIKANYDLEQFAYIVSHDLKAPLRGIERLSSWISEDCEDKLDDESKKHLALLCERCIFMSNLIEGILQYSRAGRVDLDISEVDTKALIQEIIDILQPSKTFTIRCATNMPNFMAAKIPLYQVFCNLINNSLTHHHNKAGIIDVGMHDLGSFYEFFVADNGPGIDPANFEKIFQFFKTVESNDETKSTGIGLTIVKKIVASQGGRIRVESAQKMGSVFSFTWPKQPKKHVNIHDEDKNNDKV